MVQDTQTEIEGATGASSAESAVLTDELEGETYHCNECGMYCYGNEYHPYAACLMFKSSKNGGTVRDNLNFVVLSERSRCAEQCDIRLPLAFGVDGVCADIKKRILNP